MKNSILLLSLLISLSAASGGAALNETTSFAAAESVWPAGREKEMNAFVEFRAAFRASDPALVKIFGAAMESFRQNAVDVFMDCPGRERAGCNHGFASYVAVLLVHSVLGIEVNHLEKTVTVRPTDVDLGFCGVTLPVPGGELVYDWKVVNGRRETTFRAPPGWRLR